MDQFSGGGNSGFDAPQAAPVYAPVQAPPRAGKKKLWLWIAGGAALVVLVIVLALCLAPGGAGGEEPWPVLFAEDGDVYLAAGTETIRLDDAAFAPGDSSYLNAMVSADGKTLYYLADVSGSSGEGDLMRITLGSANAEPEIIAEDVYSAQISADGKKILYLSDVENGAGDLYLCAPGGKAETIDESVGSGAFGFSPGGGLFCYTLVDGSGDQTLMLYSGGKATEVMDADDEPIWSLDVDDSGRVVFETYSFGDNGTTLYVYANGKADRISRNARHILTFGRADEFLYYTGDHELVYYARGGEERDPARGAQGRELPTRTAGRRPARVDPDPRVCTMRPP
jgi:dipeptidyl aminopeptidase/acylaminoacyl peptidase